MRIACLQFAPQVGDVDHNLNRADSVLSRANPEDLDLLVLPELAFSGYNFKSLNEISPYLEPTGAGITSLWARTTALKYNCVVAAGYPEKLDITHKWPTSPEYYNSVIVVNEDGETIANYRKTHLYYTDETWALEGPSGFHSSYIPGVGQIAMGICMDLNPYRFEAPWSAFEFAFHILDVAANVVILSMAWLTREDARHFSRMPKEPDMETLTYWVKRLEPLIRAETDDEIIVVFANRTGLEDDAVYAGTSAVIGIKHGEVSVYGLLGRGEKELLVVDTSLDPFAKLIYRPEGETNSATSSYLSQARPDSPTSSTVSKSSKLSGSQPSVSIIDAINGVPQEAGNRTIGSPFFVAQDAPTPMTGTIPTTPFEESPVSPRYFWIPPEHLANSVPGIPQSPTSSTRTNHTHSLALIKTGVTDPGAIVDTSEVFTPRNPTTEQSAQLTELAETLRKVTSDQTDGETGPARPSSPKSRNASRTGRGERSDSVLARRPPSVFGNRSQSAALETEDAVFRPESPKSRNASRNRSRGRSLKEPNDAPEQSRHHGSSSGGNHNRPTPLGFGLGSASKSQSRRTDHESAIIDTDQQHHKGPSPDMEKIDADFMVFEECERRPRRDSLECHADEDDFVVFHASQRQHSRAKNKTHADKDSERPHSSRTGKARNVDSPGFSFTRSPRESRTSSLPQVSPDLPDSRGISRGRQRNTDSAVSKGPPNSSHYRSPGLASPLKDSLKSYHHGSPGLTSPPERRNKSDLPTAANPTTRYKSPEPQSAYSKGEVEHLSQSRRDSTQRNIGPTSLFISNPLRSNDSRELSQESLNNSPNNYTSSILTVETTSTPTTPELIPRTPKAMVLSPDWDKDVPTSAPLTEKRPLKCVEQEIDRPKSAVW
ncbi:carbon-nitrogen hydrolase [Xylariales sp. AK1849]|nr:carbon-nitrogen hydrolase [Xylariales sp. AK1849]